MDSMTILAIAIGLAMDAFTVSLGAGTSEQVSAHRSVFRLSFHLGLFQAMMPVIGWLLGTTIAPVIAPIDHWVAFVLLAFVGGRMIRSGLSSGEENFSTDPSRGLTLVVLCMATSIDALAIGLSIAMLRLSIWYPSAVIGVITTLLSLLGLSLGRRLGSQFGKRMEIVGGLFLVLIGVRIVAMHILD